MSKHAFKTLALILVLASRFVSYAGAQADAAPSAVAQSLNEAAKKLYDRAFDASKAHDYTTAITLYKKAAEIDPKFPGLWNDLGRAQLRAGLVPDAIKSLEHQIVLDPRDDLARRNLSRAYYAAGEVKKARTICEEQIQLFPGDDFCRLQIGGLLMQEQKFAEAIPALERAAVFLPSEPFIRVQIGQAKLNTGDYKGALDAFQTATRIANIPSVWAGVGAALTEEGTHLDDAITYLNTGIAGTKALLNKAVQLKKYEDGRVLSYELMTEWVFVYQALLRQRKVTEAEPIAAAIWKSRMIPDVGDDVAKIYKARSKNTLADAIMRELDSTYPRQPNGRRLDPSNSCTNVDVPNSREALAKFYVALTPAGEVQDLEMVGEVPNIEFITQKIKRTIFPAGMPDKDVTTIVRRGTFQCTQQGGRCGFCLDPAAVSIESLSRIEAGLTTPPEAIP